MKGYVAKVSFDLSKGCTYKYFKDKEEAQVWAEDHARHMFEHNGMEQEIEVAPMELKECALLHCHELVPLDEAICLRCEKIQHDIQMDQQAEMCDKLTEAELLNDW